MIDHVNSEYLKEIVELTDAELDAVAAGALVNVLVPVTVSHSLNNNQISVAAQALTNGSTQQVFQRVPPV